MCEHKEKEPSVDNLNKASKDMYDALKEIVETQWIGGRGGLVRARKALDKARGAHD